MSIKSLICLWGIAISLLVITLNIRSKQNLEITSDTKVQVGKALLSNLDSELIHEIKIHSKEESKHFKKIGGNWVLPEKDDFPVNGKKLIKELTELFDSKVSQPLKTSNKYYDRFGVDNESESLTKIEFYNENGEKLEQVYLGNSIKGAREPMMGAGAISKDVGRRARLNSDPDTIYSLSQTLTGLESDASNWLEKNFIKIENIKSITKEEVTDLEENWVLERNGKDDSFKLLNVPEGKQIKQSTIDRFKSLFKIAYYEEVLGKKAFSDWIKDHPTSKVNKYSITTFDGFSYQIQIAPKNGEKENNSYVFSYEVEYQKLENEVDDESGKDNETSFKDKLENQQVFSKYLYVVKNNVVETLLQNKKDFLEDFPEPTSEDEKTEEIEGESGSDELK